MNWTLVFIIILSLFVVYDTFKVIRSYIGKKKSQTELKEVEKKLALVKDELVEKQKEIEKFLERGKEKWE